MIYLIFILAIVLNAAANILIKLGMRGGGVVNFNQLGLTLVNLITNFYFLGGLVSFGLALVFYSFVLQKINLSVAYPIMTSVGFVFVILVSVLFLKESLTFWQMLGILLIVAGVWLVAAK